MSRKSPAKRKKQHARRRKKAGDVPDLGTAAFRCPDCGTEFEVPWLDIFDLQETTHGFVGFYISEEYIACPECGENANVDHVGDEAPEPFCPF